MKKHPLISIVAPCHGETTDLPRLVACLRGQLAYGTGKCTRTGCDVRYVPTGACDVPWELVVCSDGPYIADTSVLDGDQVRLQECLRSDQPCSGHNTRDPGLRATRGEWIVLTNSDNLLVAGFLSRVASEIGPEIGMVYWDCVNSLWKWGNLGGCRLEWGHIDLSCAAVRRCVALEVGFPWRHYDADWDYLSQCAGKVAERGLRVVHIEETLIVHN